jgi:amino acid adenylation domain-containing protein
MLAGPDVDLRPNPAVPLAPLVLESVQQAFEANALKFPRRDALVTSWGVWTYGELDQLSGALAGLLRSRGVEPGQVVALIADRNPILVIAMIAVLRAGAAFAIVNEAYPDARVEKCLRVSAAGLSLLIGTAQRFDATLGREHSRLLLPTDRGEFLRLVAGHAPPSPSEVRSETTAYLMFTSGSTGEPKCVATGHAPLPHFIQWQKTTFALDRDDRFSMLSGLSHDPFLRDVFTPLSIGASLHLPQSSTLLDPMALYAWLQASRITVAHLTPPLGRIVAAGKTDQPLESLSWWFWGGDTLHPSLVRELEPIAPRARHVNFYGTTETPQAVGFYEVDSLKGVGRIPIGRGIRDFELLVLREGGALASIGEIGELAVRSRYLSQGYFRDAATNKDKYRVNPQTREAGDRLYRTGDLAMFLPDGLVELHGRADDQVKVRGFRVELGEVSAALLRTGLIREATVLGRTAASGDLQIAAYVVAADGAVTTPSTINERLKLELPVHMRPTTYLILPKLPLLPNGKVDRQALLALPLAVTHDEAPAGNARERELAKSWAQVLGLPTVGIDESFYELGGDSLTAVRVMLSMRSLGLDEATCRQILEGRTIAEIARGGAVRARPNKEVQRRLAINMMRGVLTTLVVVSHWLDGLARRVPPLLKLEMLANPILSWSTPGFAMVFGMALAQIHLPLYQSSPARVRILLVRSGLLLGAGVLLLAVDHYLLQLLNLGDAPTPVVTQHPYLTLFDGVLTYYALALLSAPLWFRVLSGPGSFPKAIVIGVALIAIYRYLVGFEYPPGSLAQLSVGLGKFSYINLSGGAFLGMALGTSLKSRSEVPIVYLWLGLGLTVAGGLLSFVDNPIGFFGMSNVIEVWKWLYYTGLMLVSLYWLDHRLSHASEAFQRASHWLAVVGQLAFPIVLLDYLSRDMGHFGNYVGRPALRIMIPLVLFVGAATFLVRKTHRLYYGSSSPKAA